MQSPLRSSPNTPPCTHVRVMGCRRGKTPLAIVARMPKPIFVPLRERHDPGVPALKAARSHCEIMRRRRSVRMFSDRPVSRATIEWIVRTAGTAPSGANKQPWRFVCVQDPDLKRKIRVAAEKEEHEFYTRRANERWLRDLRSAPTSTRSSSKSPPGSSSYSS